MIKQRQLWSVIASYFHEDFYHWLEKSIHAPDDEETIELFQEVVKNDPDARNNLYKMACGQKPENFQYLRSILDKYAEDELNFYKEVTKEINNGTYDGTF